MKVGHKKRNGRYKSHPVPHIANRGRHWRTDAQRRFVQRRKEIADRIEQAEYDAALTAIEGGSE